jgi:hypothetical protein
MKLGVLTYYRLLAAFLPRGVTTMTSPSNSPPEKAPIPVEAKWDQLAALLPASVAQIGDFVDADLSELERRFFDFMTPNSVKKSLRSERQ